MDFNNMKFIDLFCGIGGFHQALTKLNCKCVFASDINKDSRQVYYNNYNIEPVGDIRNINAADIPDFDIICAGFPCQPFSNAGKKKSFDDDKGLLFDEIIRIAKEKNPKFMFLENVKHIKKISEGKVFKYILKEIKNAGYFIDEDKTVFTLSPHQLGIPQQRERIIFVCIRNDIYDKNKQIELNIPKKIPKQNFDKILEPRTNTKYKVNKEIISVLKCWDKMIKKMDVGQRLSPTILCKEFKTKCKDFKNKEEQEEFENLVKWKQDYITKNKPIYNKYKKKWDKWFDKNKELLCKKEIYAKLEWQAGIKKENDSIFNYFIQLRQSGIRVKKTKYFPTLVAIVQTPIYAKEKRYITPRECARLQSFPDDFILHEKDRIAYKQFGNAVNVDVIYTVVNATFKAYKNNNKKIIIDI